MYIDARNEILRFAQNDKTIVGMWIQTELET
jgi:hypothetical protein